MLLELNHWRRALTEVGSSTARKTLSLTRFTPTRAWQWQSLRGRNEAKEYQRLSSRRECKVFHLPKKRTSSGCVLRKLRALFLKIALCLMLNNSVKKEWVL